MNRDESNRWKVGELAKATGLTVRTLHHYDELGLLRASGRTPAGHRYYLPKDLERLQRIASLRQLGLSLEQIGECLQRPDFTLLPVLERQLQTLDERIAEQSRLRARIASLAEQLRNDENVTARDLLTTIEETTMFEKHFTKDQLQWLEQHKQQTGPARMQEVEREWPELLAAVRAEMDKGTAPTDPVVQELAQRWQALVAEFTQGRQDIADGVAKLFHEEPQAREHAGLDMDVMRYIGKAMPDHGEFD